MKGRVLNESEVMRIYDSLVKLDRKTAEFFWCMSKTGLRALELIAVSFEGLHEGQSSQIIHPELRHESIPYLGFLSSDTRPTALIWDTTDYSEYRLSKTRKGSAFRIPGRFQSLTTEHGRSSRSGKQSRRSGISSNAWGSRLSNIDCLKTSTSKSPRNSFRRLPQDWASMASRGILAVPSIEIMRSAIQGLKTSFIGSWALICKLGQNITWLQVLVHSDSNSNHLMLMVLRGFDRICRKFRFEK